MRRLVMVWAVAALMAALMALMAAPAMANDLFGGFLNDNDRFDHHRHGLFDRDDDEEDLDTIRVGDWRCLVEDRDDVEFCVNKDTGEIFRP